MEHAVGTHLLLIQIFSIVGRMVETILVDKDISIELSVLKSGKHFSSKLIYNFGEHVLLSHHSEY